jgi:hypothetical protein
MIKKSNIPLPAEIQTSQMFEFRNSLIALKRDYASNMTWGYMQLQKLMNELIQVDPKKLSPGIK